MNEWISVKEIPPSENHEIFLVSDGDCVTFAFWDDIGFVGWEKEIGEITHWMPLPLPPSIDE
jgi:hypothetical protein